MTQSAVAAAAGYPPMFLIILLAQLWLLRKMNLYENYAKILFSI